MTDSTETRARDAWDAARSPSTPFWSELCNSARADVLAAMLTLSTEAEASGYERGVRDERERVTDTLERIAYTDWYVTHETIKEIRRMARDTLAAIRAGITDPENDHG